MRLRPSLLALLLFSLNVQAQRPAFLDQMLAVEIEADSAELSEERGVSVYHGNVVLRRGPLEMRGDELRIRRDDRDGRIEATLAGSPARATHQLDANEDPVVATAKRIVYTTISEILELLGNARIARGDDELTGEQVRYDVGKARIEAEGGGDRVRIVITPSATAPEAP